MNASCKNHPKYAAKQRPRTPCLRCWALWVLTHERYTGADFDSIEAATKEFLRTEDYTE